MRLVLALSIIAVSAVSAHAAEDRYGPPRGSGSVPAGPQVASALPASSAPWSGQMLSWGGKTPAQAPAAVATAAPAMPQPIAPWAGPAPTPQRAAYPSIAAPVAAPIPAAYTPPPARPAAPAPQAAAAQPLPASLYDRPAAPAPVAAAPAPQPQPQPQQPYQPPRTQASTLPPPPSTPTRVRSPDEASPRAYSVLREFGGTPDPINIPPPTSYWATRPETAPAPAEAEDAGADFGPAGGVGAADVASADSLSPEEEAAKRRKRELLKERAAAAAEAGK